MIDVGTLIAVGWAAFFAGIVYANRQNLAALREAARARALVVDGVAFILSPLLPQPGGRTTIDITVPKRVGDLVCLPGGKPEDAA